MLKAGVIGLGGIFAVHRPAIEKYGLLCAVCDVKPEKLRPWLDREGIFATTDWRELIARPDIDVVHILTPHYLHAEMAIEALAHGKHVVLEKPMAIRTDDARRIIRAADKACGSLNIIFQNRYNASAILLKKIADSGEAGRFLGGRAIVTWCRDAAYYARDPWRGKWATEGGGPLINQAIHTLDLFSWLGGPIERVKGHISTDLLGDCIEVEDNAHAVAEFASGARGVIYVSNSHVVDSLPQVDLIFEKAQYQLLGPNLFRMENHIPVLLTADSAAPGIDAKACWGTGHDFEIRRIYHCIQAGEPFEIDGRSGFAALALTEAIYASNASGDWAYLAKAD